MNVEEADATVVEYVLVMILDNKKKMGAVSAALADLLGSKVATPLVEWLCEYIRDLAETHDELRQREEDAAAAAARELALREEEAAAVDEGRKDAAEVQEAYDRRKFAAWQEQENTLAAARREGRVPMATQQGTLDGLMRAMRREHELEMQGSFVRLCGVVMPDDEARRHNQSRSFNQRRGNRLFDSALQQSVRAPPARKVVVTGKGSGSLKTEAGGGEGMAYNAGGRGAAREEPRRVVEVVSARKRSRGALSPQFHGHGPKRRANYEGEAPTSDSNNNRGRGFETEMEGPPLVFNVKNDVPPPPPPAAAPMSAAAPFFHPSSYPQHQPYQGRGGGYAPVRGGRGASSFHYHPYHQSYAGRGAGRGGRNMSLHLGPKPEAAASSSMPVAAAGAVTSPPAAASAAGPPSATLNRSLIRNPVTGRMTHHKVWVNPALATTATSTAAVKTEAPQASTTIVKQEGDAMNE